LKSIRSLPRAFIQGASFGVPILLPPEELNKFTKVLRLTDGDEIAILPNDGTLIRAQLNGKSAVPLEQIPLRTEHSKRLTLIQALPKGDKSESIVQAGTELGVASFVFFPSDRSIVRWEADKRDQKLRRLTVVAREAAEQSFRARIPTVTYLASLSAVFQAFPAALALSESEMELKTLDRETPELALTVGPEGGWSPAELQLIGDRGITLGPRVLRTEHAGPAAAAVYLLA
jgi:16S rRNA (uracil1498-N3)-methyltransferase